MVDSSSSLCKSQAFEIGSVECFCVSQQFIMLGDFVVKVKRNLSVQRQNNVVNTREAEEAGHRLCLLKSTSSRVDFNLVRERMTFLRSGEVVQPYPKAIRNYLKTKNGEQETKLTSGKKRM